MEDENMKAALKTRNEKFELGEVKTPEIKQPD